MKKKPVFPFIVLAALVGMSSTLEAARADGTPITSERCTTWGDSLEQGDQVRLRYTYALRCAQETGAMETAFNISKIYKGILHSDGRTMTAGYPIYGVFAPASMDDPVPYKNPKNWFAPKTPDRVNEPCVSKVDGDGFKPAEYKIIAYCASGCYTPDQSLLIDPVQHLSLTALDLYKDRITQAASITEDSRLGDVRLKTIELDTWMTDLQPARQSILRFTTLSGGTLKVTDNHPLVNADGEIQPASRFKVGDSLVSSDGKPDPILEIQSMEYFGRVYNFSVNSNVDTDHVLVAQGFLNGSLRFQNEEVKKANRRLLRESIAADLISKYEN